MEENAWLKLGVVIFLKIWRSPFQVPGNVSNVSITNGNGQHVNVSTVTGNSQISCNQFVDEDEEER